MHIYAFKENKETAMSYRKQNSKFSGSVFYTTLEGDFINGWIYKEGKIIKSTGKAKLANAKLMCEITEIDVFERYCEITSAGQERCGAWQFIYTHTSSYCSYVPDDQPGGGVSTQSTYIKRTDSIIDLLTDYPCASALLTQLPDMTATTKSILNGIFKDNSDVHITYQVNKSLPWDTDGEAVCANNGG